MCLNDLVANGQAGSRPLEFFARMEPPEKLKNRRVKLRLDPDSIVSDGNRHFGIWVRAALEARRIDAGLDNRVDFDPRVRALVIFYAIR